MQLRAAGIRSIPTNADVTVISQCSEMVDKTLAEFGRVDILVTIPALMIYKDFAHCTPKELHQQTDVTFWGTVNAVKAALDAMIRQRSGSIVCMGSDSAKMGPAMEGHLRRLQVGHHDLRQQPLQGDRDIRGESQCGQRRAGQIPGGRSGHGGSLQGELSSWPAGRGERSGPGIVFLASDGASFITGQTLSVNGGRL